MLVINILSKSGAKWVKLFHSAPVYPLYLPFIAHFNLMTTKKNEPGFPNSFLFLS